MALKLVHGAHWDATRFESRGEPVYLCVVGRHDAQVGGRKWLGNVGLVYLYTDHSEPARARGHREGAMVRRQQEILTGVLAPQERGREMNRIECP